MITKIRLASVMLSACLLAVVTTSSIQAQVGFQLSIGPYPGVYGGLPYGPFGPPVGIRRSFYLPPPPMPVMRVPTILVPVPSVSVQRYLSPSVPTYSAQARYYGPQPQYPPNETNRSPNSVYGANDLRPGMVLPDGATVVSVDPIGSGSSSPSSQVAEPTPAPPQVIPASGSEPRRAAF